MRANVEYRKNVGMVQGSGGEGLSLKAAQPVGVTRKRRRQDFDRYFAFETRVAGTVDHAHATRTEGQDNLVGPESCTGVE